MNATPTGQDPMKEAERLTAMAERCGATVYRNRASVHSPAVAFGDEAWARFCKLVEAQPAAVAGEAAPVTLEPLPGCHCEACDPIQPTRVESGELVWPTNLRMIVCAICGNKRCPHATDHRLTCTNSNEPGQPGSGYGPSKAVFVLRGHAAPAAPLVGEPTEMVMGEPDARGYAIFTPATSGWHPAIYGEQTAGNYASASPAAPAGVPTINGLLEMVADFGDWRFHTGLQPNKAPAPCDLFARIRTYAERLASANSFHPPACDSSEASGSAIPARPTLPGEVGGKLKVTLQDSPYERMFNAAVYALAEVSKALGIPDDEAAAANGNELILDAIESREQTLLNLLAVIHRDGGQYASEHGTEKAAKDAEAKVFALLAGGDQMAAPVHPSAREGCNYLAKGLCNKCGQVHPSSVQAVDGDEPT